jgi:transcriptional regulator with XRE-family HTH domain
MKTTNMRFGDFIRYKRIHDKRELTLKDVADKLGFSLSLLSDIEQGRRKPFNSEKIDLFCKYLELSNEDRNLMYDLAARDRKEIPSDLDDIMMYSEIGNMARYALRQSNAGIVTEEDWKKFIREIDKKRGQKYD